MSNLAKPPTDELISLAERAAYYGKSTIADGTRRAYEAEFAHFKVWADERGLPSLPTDVPTVACYLAALADGGVKVTWVNRAGQTLTSQKPYKYGSIQHNYQAIVHAQRGAGVDWPFAHPAITKVMHGIKYRHGAHQKRMDPLEIADLKACLGKMKERRYEDLTIIRDRAILAVGFFSACRRSEIVGLRLEDLQFTDHGLILTIRKSKTDQFAIGETLGLTAQKDPTICPVSLLQRYLQVSELKSGPLFRRIDSRSDCMGDKPLTPQVVAMIVKQYAELAGLDPERFAGHSLRAGFVTSAAAKGVTLHNIMRQTRHKSERVAMTYIRPATVWRGNPTEGLGDDEPLKGK